MQPIDLLGICLIVLTMLWLIAHKRKNDRMNQHIDQAINLTKPKRRQQ